jgi:hypothetical protein
MDLKKTIIQISVVVVSLVVSQFGACGVYGGGVCGGAVSVPG